MNIFISHAPTDDAFARDLSDQLKQTGFEVWLAEEQLAVGENFALRTGRALEQADAIVFVLSQAAVKSPNLALEVNYAIGNAKFKGQVVSVMIDPVKKIPWILNRLAIIHSSNPVVAGRRVAQALEPMVQVQGETKWKSIALVLNPPARVPRIGSPAPFGLTRCSIDPIRPA
ncbi:MAG TPA: toll/interleukin-1 receptor domain-containing protein [Tepidisphaeraceae bacterium]|nr:toll/interleukin-1 receptor domain-containing protein [Tepidisphaeraceae bacterium]